MAKKKTQAKGNSPFYFLKHIADDPATPPRFARVARRMWEAQEGQSKGTNGAFESSSAQTLASSTDDRSASLASTVHALDRSSQEAGT